MHRDTFVDRVKRGIGQVTTCSLDTDSIPDLRADFEGNRTLDVRSHFRLTMNALPVTIEMAMMFRGWFEIYRMDEQIALYHRRTGIILINATVDDLLRFVDTAEQWTKTLPVCALNEIPSDHEG